MGRFRLVVPVVTISLDPVSISGVALSQI
ncbi:hypothetical protein A2U01_0115168, partial [Trifolium medium]|nr:hypothetical protein [Trifolium medium]